MNATTYNILMIVSFALSGVFLAVAILLFFKLKIKSAVDELSGKKSRRQVEEIRKENIATKSRGYVPGIFKNRNDKTTTSLADTSSRKLKRVTENLSDEDEKMKLDEVLEKTEGTVVLNEPLNGRTDSEEGTSILGGFADNEGTTFLNENDEGTTLLNEGVSENTNRKKCTVIREITVMESEDYIKVD